MKDWSSSKHIQVIYVLIHLNIYHVLMASNLLISIVFIAWFGMMKEIVVLNNHKQSIVY